MNLNSHSIKQTWQKLEFFWDLIDRETPASSKTLRERKIIHFNFFRWQNIASFIRKLVYQFQENVFKFKILHSSISLRFLFVTQRPQRWISELLFSLSRHLFWLPLLTRRRWSLIRNLRTAMVMTCVPTITCRFYPLKH